CLTACSLNSAVYSCFGIFFTSLPSGFDAIHRPLEDEKRQAAHFTFKVQFHGQRGAPASHLKSSVRLKAEGSVEVAFAEGKVAGNLYLPSKEGIMLYYLDAEQLVDVAKGRSVDTGRYDLGAIRLACQPRLLDVLQPAERGVSVIGVHCRPCFRRIEVLGLPVGGRGTRINRVFRPARQRAIGNAQRHRHQV
ncbi:MAG: hypothetical protein ACOZD0_09900, partial [Pseudomonadota bacterium]